MAHPAPPALTRLRPHPRWWYALGVLVLGLIQGTTELQGVLGHGSIRPWEPYLWELSSVLLLGCLAPLVYRWHVASLGGRWLLWRHALGAMVFMLAHVGGMFAIRFAVYGIAGLRYNPGSVGEVLAYESGKDLVSYALITAISHGLHLFIESQRLRSELAEARLARLSEQLQPHFLFNSLNLISSVMYEDVARADRLLCELATLLRQTLAAQQATQHSLGEELLLIEPYLALMQARFGPRLQVSVDVDEAARRCAVPTLLLISPVENAIKHDVAHSDAPVRVSIRAWLAGKQLHLRVANSGRAPQHGERDGGIGLHNLRQRLRALHGDAAQLSLSAGAEGGSELNIQLPATSVPAP